MKDSFFYKNKSIVAFLILELLALVSFTFANIADILNFFGALVAIIAFVFAYSISEDKKEFKKLIPVVAVLFLVSGIASFGGFGSSIFSSFSNIVTFVAIPGFFSLGYLTRSFKDIKIDNVLLSIGFGFAAITLIGTISTWIQYGPFYPLIAEIKGLKYYYYNGLPYDVTKEMSWMLGFTFEDISIDYGSLFALLSTSFLPSLLFLSYKEKRNQFLASLVIGGIGLVSLITVCNFSAIIVLLIGTHVALIYKLSRKYKKVYKVFSKVFFVILCLGVVFYLATIVNALFDFKAPGFIGKVLTNPFISKATEVLEVAFAKNDFGRMFNLFGLNLKNPTYDAIFNLSGVAISNTGIFEYQIIKEIGVIGALIFVGFLVYMVIRLGSYLEKGNDPESYKITLLVMILVFFIYSSISNNIIPEIHNPSNYIAFLRSAPFMIILFMLGLMYSSKEVEEIK